MRVRRRAGSAASATPSGLSASASLAAWPEISAALTVVPYYSRPGEPGVLEHFRVLAAAGPVPLIIYNVPYRTGQPVARATMVLHRRGEIPTAAVRLPLLPAGSAAADQAMATVANLG